MPLQILSYNKAKDSEQIISLHCNILLNEFYYLTVEEATDSCAPKNQFPTV